MAAYSYHPHHFLLSSSTLLIPNTPFDISTFYNNMMLSPNDQFSGRHNVGTTTFSDAVNVMHHQSICLDYSSKMQSATSSIEMEKVEEKKSRKGRPSLHSSQSKRRKVQGKKARKENECDGENVQVQEKKKKTKASKKNTKDQCSDDTHKDYIHVRARRGQATDSHSLAERVRRERISERMKMLQALVPGCEKVTGKALMLDEIINYVQSLQTQIEFLSMKLASFNPIHSNLAMDHLDAAILKQAERFRTLASSQSSGSSQLYSPTVVNNYNSSTTTLTIGLLHPLIESSLLQQQELAAEKLAWDQIDSQTQNFMNQSAGLRNATCSFQ